MNSDQFGLFEVQLDADPVPRALDTSETQCFGFRMFSGNFFAKPF